MDVKVQNFQGLRALLIAKKAEYPGKHLQRTSDFSLGTLIPQRVYGPGKDPALRTKKQSVRRNPLKSQWPYGRWYRNQGALVPRVKPDDTALRNTIRTTTASIEMFASWEILSKLLVAMERKGPKHVHQ